MNVSILQFDVCCQTFLAISDGMRISDGLSVAFVLASIRHDDVYFAVSSNTAVTSLRYLAGLSRPVDDSTTREKRPDSVHSSLSQETVPFRSPIQINACGWREMDGQALQYTHKYVCCTRQCF